MKIGILTFHSQLNYGGVLQCWALQTALQKLGYEVVVIDRWLDKTNGFLRGIRFNSLSLKEKLKRLINLSFMLGESSCRQRRRVTEHFLAEKINLTECSFYQWDEIKKHLDEKISLGEHNPNNLIEGFTEYGIDHIDYILNQHHCYIVNLFY